MGYPRDGRDKEWKKERIAWSTSCFWLYFFIIIILKGIEILLASMSRNKEKKKTDENKKQFNNYLGC